MRPYLYNAVVLAVHDGDTLTVSLDLGFNLRLQLTVRLVGINARELAEPGGPEARDALGAYLPPGREVSVRTLKPDKFGGRYDADVWLDAGHPTVSELMVATGWAAAWNGRGPKPVPPWPRKESP